jgi:hypothetical protein
MEQHFPAEVEFEGLSFYRTGKIGKHLATGEIAAEYEADDHDMAPRVWMTESGLVQAE